MTIRIRWLRSAAITSGLAGTSGTTAPYAMVLYRNGLYVVAAPVGRTGEHEQSRVCAAERFVRVDAQRKTSFEVPDSFFLDDYFDGAFGVISGSRKHHVVVEFPKRLRTEATIRCWHRSQHQTEWSAGGVLVEFNVTSLRQVVSWVLSWGSQVRVVQPADLRARVVNELRKAQDLYSP